MQGQRRETNRAPLCGFQTNGMADENNPAETYASKQFLLERNQLGDETVVRAHVRLELLDVRHRILQRQLLVCRTNARAQYIILKRKIKARSENMTCHDKTLETA